MSRHDSGPDPAAMDLRRADVRRRMSAEGPVGEWETMPGTHTALMSDLIRFAQDGTGEIRGDSVLFGATVERFTWSVVRPGLLACVAVDDSADGTQEVGFRFEEQRSDVGTFWVMRDPDWDGFWHLPVPVVPRRTD